MDKFTVDLDQVLNDFEFSELQDQYNTTSKQTNSSSSSVTQNVTKHPINHVFHSLNEYIKTDISTGTLNTQDNNHSNNFKGDFPNLSYGENSVKEDFKTEPTEKVEMERAVMNIDECYDKAEANKESVTLDEQLLESQLKKIDLNNPVNLLSHEGTKEDSFTINECTNLLEEEPIENPTNKAADTENNLDLHTELQNIVGNDFGVGCEQNNVKPSVEVENLKTIIGFEKDIHLDDQEMSRLLSELEEDDDLIIDTDESPTNINKDSSESPFLGNSNQSNNGGDNSQRTFVDVTVKTDEITENDSDMNINTNDQSQCEVPIECNYGRNDYNLENEKNMLYEQDIEVESVHSQLKIQCEIEITKDVITDKEISAKSISEHAESINISPSSLKEEIDKSGNNLAHEEEKEIHEIGKKNQEENTNDETYTDLNKNQTHHRNLHEGEKVKESSVSSESASAVLESSSDENKEEITDNSSPCIQREESSESVPRPQNLPLDMEAKDNRNINLIGDPGSTPYNNFYVNNEIGRQDSNDIDSSCTSTSSSSLSDESSTASIGSADDIPYKKDNNTAEDIKRTDEESINIEGNSAQNSSNVNSSLSQQNSDFQNDVLDDEATERGDSGIRNPENDGSSAGKDWLGKTAPLWIPDSEAMTCLHCDMKFTMLKRRHHCRACGLVLCAKCCHLRFRLEYLDAEARVCNRCHDILNKGSSSGSSSDISPEVGNSPSHRPNPNNPAEYCSTISPLQQVSSSQHSPPSVMVPVGVLKRKGSNKAKSSKSVMFCDGIRPGSDLTNLDNDFNYNNTITKKLEKNNASAGKIVRDLPLIDSETNTFIPKNENSLPPTVTFNKSDVKYTECPNNMNTVNLLKESQLSFALHLSLLVHVRIINMDCCVNKVAWCFSTEGLINVGQDEIVILLEFMEEESTVPKDIFYHITTIYNDAVKGNSVKELGLSLQNSTSFLNSKNHAGFIYIRPTFQCLEKVIKPKDPYLIGILIHRWETPWAKLFPLRLVLRLGAEYRYYPSPIISTRHRDSLYVEIGHTIINILADFRNFSYSLPQIRGLTIHMEEKVTTVNIPVNRYDQVVKSLNNSSDHILAFAGNFSVQADSHLVCIQDTQGNENCYSTHAINIHNKPRKITGASFIVFNGALKSSSGLIAKSNIIEDGLMVQVLPEHLKQIRENLRAMKNHTISCGCVDNVSDETVQIVWSENDTNFNVGVISTIDNLPLSGVPSIRVHNGKNYICHNGSRIIRWTEVFIIQNGEDNQKNQDPVDISRVSESIAKATCDALVKYLDLLIANSFQKIGIRVTLHVDNVSYCAGSNGIKLPPIYMKSLDNELIPVLLRITSNNFGENAIVLELIFRILNV